MLRAATLRWAIAVALLAAPCGAWAQGVRIGGSVGTAFQLRLNDCSSPESCYFLNFRNANVVRLEIEAQPSATTELRADIAVRNINFAEIETLDDTGEISNVQPVDIRINEARLALYDLFGATGLDIEAGAMRVAWGTGDGVNPTDIANPYNLEDGTGFDQRLSSLAIQLSYSVADVRLEVVVLPIFMPGILPIDHIDFTALGDPQDVFSLLDDEDEPPEVHQVDTPTSTPEAALDNVSVGARLKYTSPVGDFALMFFRGFETIPQASGQARLTGFQTTSRVDLGVPLVYPRIMMAGADYRGPIVGSLSMWAEVAVLIPEEHRLTAAQNQLEQLVKLGHLSEVPDPIPSQVTQSDDVYVKAVAGLEYIIADQVYLNLQYARGLPSERQSADIHDYVLFGARWALLDGQVTLEARGAMEIADADTLGYQAGGAISYLHGDAARLTLSCTFLGGQDGTTMRRFEKLSHLALEFELGF